jgi:hypothetical protein
MTLLFKLRIPMKDVCTANILLHFGKTKNFFYDLYNRRFSQLDILFMNVAGQFTAYIIAD